MMAAIWENNLTLSTDAVAIAVVFFTNDWRARDSLSARPITNGSISVSVVVITKSASVAKIT